MKTVRAKLRRKRTLLETEEPRSYDRRFYARALLASFLVIVVTAGFLVYRLAVYSEPPPRGPSFDLSSLFVGGIGALPDPRNPALVLQEHLEATRQRSYRKAYEYFCGGLKSQVSLRDFRVNAASNSLLFEEIKDYRFGTYEVTGTSARTSGCIIYHNGAKSRVDAEFAREGGEWKIALVTVVYQ